MAIPTDQQSARTAVRAVIKDWSTRRGAVHPHPQAPAHSRSRQARSLGAVHALLAEGGEVHPRQGYLGRDGPGGYPNVPTLGGACGKCASPPYKIPCIYSGEVAAVGRPPLQSPPSRTSSRDTLKRSSPFFGGCAEEPSRFFDRGRSWLEVPRSLIYTLYICAATLCMAQSAG